MKKKYVGITLLAAFLILFVVIPVFALLFGGEGRTLQRVKLEDTTYQEVSFVFSSRAGAALRLDTGVSE